MRKKAHEENKKITYKTVSKATGLSVTTLNYIANKKNYVTRTKTIEILCNYFKCEVSDFMEIVDH